MAITRVFCRGHVSVLLALALVATTVAGCKPKSYEDIEYLAERLKEGDEQAYRYVRRLEDPEARVAAIPALVDAFNAGADQEDILRILLDVGHPDARPAFEAALEADDSALAGLGARGLGAIGADDSVGAIASRLRRVRDPSHFEPFLEALRQLQGRPEVAPVLVEILSRLVGRIGGIETVRAGCEILGKSGNTEAATIDAIIFSFVNFVPQPYQDARFECELALVRLGEAAAEPLFAMFLEQNQTVNEHLRSIRYEPVVGSLRAAWALADGQIVAVRDGMLEWFNTPQQLDGGYLAGLPLEDQQTWFQNYGQMFEQAAAYLGWLGEPGEEDAAHLLLRSMLARGEGSPLENFHQFMNTSGGAELGLRAGVINALVNIGDPADRDAILEIAMAGDLTRGPDILLRQEGAHAFGLMSQPDDLERFQLLLNAIDNAGLRENVEPYRIMVDIAVECQHQVDCLANYLTHESLWAREKAAHDLSHYAENGAAAAAALLDQLDHPDINTRVLYARALRHLPLPQTGAEQISAALEANAASRFRDVEHEILLLRSLKQNR